MSLSQWLVSRFHQSRTSEVVKRVPGIRLVAQKWWTHTQEGEFRSAMSRLQPPKVGASHVMPLGRVDVPSVGEIKKRDPKTVELGEAFSRKMGQWCQTSKFQSLGYQDVYARILSDLDGMNPRVLEVGIGVNDPSVPSGMGKGHEPGASLVGWNSYFQAAEVHGADIDRRVLIDTEFYKTHHVDQRSETSLRQLASQLEVPIELIVDDGLHTPEANAKTVVALLPLLAPSGVYVVEDIIPEFNYLWEELGSWIEPHYNVSFFSGEILRSGRGEGMAVLTRLT